MYQNEYDEDDDRRTQAVRPCDRRPIAYDVVKKERSTRDNQNKKSDELPDSFFDLTAEDLRSVLNSIRQQE